MLKPIILLDFDETLIDTSEIKGRLFSLAEKIGASEEEAMSVYIAFKPFRKEKYEELKASNNPVIRRFLKEFHLLFAKPREFNYPGVAQFLRALSEHYIIFLCTYGDRRVQQLKIRQSELRQFFDRVIITPDPTKEKVIANMAKQYRGRIALVDDAPTVCDVAQAYRMPVVRIKKGHKDQAYYQSIVLKLSRIFTKH